MVVPHVPTSTNYTYMAYIKKRNTTWYACWTLDGKKIVKTTGIPVAGRHGQKPKDAKREAELAADAMEQASKGTPVDRTLDLIRAAAVASGYAKPIPSVRALLEAVPRNSKASSENNRTRAHQCFMEFLGAKADCRADKIDEETCRVFITTQLQRVSVATVNMYRTYLTLAFKRGKESGLLNVNPWDLVSVPKIAKTVKNAQHPEPRQPFTIEELRFMMSDRFPLPWRDMVAVSWYCYGLRLSDVCQLRWDNIDFEAKVIRLTEQKTEKLRVMPISEELAAILKRRKGDGLSHPDEVFPTMAERYRHSPGYISTQFTSLLRAHGIISADDEGAKKAQGTHRVSRKSFHSIRHSVVSCLRSDARFTADVVRDAVGHENEAVERGYFTASLQQRAVVGNALVDALK